MSRQIAIGAVVGFALTVLVLSVAERSGQGPGSTAELRIADAGILVPAQLIEPKAKRGGAEEPPVREGRHLGRPALIQQYLGDGGL
jgi:hypothetical protein